MEVALDRDLDGNDVVHITKVSPTGQLSQVDTPVTLDQLVEFLRARLVPSTAVEEPAS